MKYITNFFGVGCVALLAMLIMAPGAFAQQITTADPPSDLAAAVGNTTDETAAQEGRITLTWSPVPEANNGGSPILTGAAGYQIEVTEDPTDETSWAVVPDGEITVAVPSDLTADDAEFTAVHALPADATVDPPVTNHNETRHYRVKTVNGVGTGDPSTVVMETTHDVPPAPTGLAAVAGDASDATAQQHERITVTWEQVPEDDTDLPITDGDGGYILEFSEDPDAGVQRQNFLVPTTKLFTVDA
ncbi:MAG: fibronectin type III domain-containing protein, partial [Bacteroidetes bacterium]|nr:fibronectin type III domain-containing protein [Bacteroidota bacterium]MDE2671128.1 fibronectin type III domain-containing protein [Bacteroidota bacterium]